MIFLAFPTFREKILLLGGASQLARQPASWPANQPVDLSARRQPAATAQNLNFSLKSRKSRKNQGLAVKTQVF